MMKNNPILVRKTTTTTTIKKKRINQRRRDLVPVMLDSYLGIFLPKLRLDKPDLIKLAYCRRQMEGCIHCQKFSFETIFPFFI